jgi:transcription initiation factor TFIID subunit TAF12
MHQYYDYCDTYESYDSGLALDNKNKIRTFSCNVCKQSKLVLKKSVSDPVFKCEECITAHSKLQLEEQQQQQQQEQQQQQQQQDQGQQETTWKWFSFF